MADRQAGKWSRAASRGQLYHEIREEMGYSQAILAVGLGLVGWGAASGRCEWEGVRGEVAEESDHEALVNIVSSLAA